MDNHSLRSTLTTGIRRGHHNNVNTNIGIKLTSDKNTGPLTQYIAIRYFSHYRRSILISHGPRLSIFRFRQAKIIHVFKRLGIH